MTDRERTIYELCRFYEEGLCSSPETPKRTNECIKGECVVFEGYTRQLEPSMEKVEAVAKIIERIMYPDYYPEEVRKDAAERVAHSILSLFPEPVLTRISDTEIMAILRCAFTVSIPQGAFDAITNAVEAQLAHAQKQIKGE